MSDQTPQRIVLSKAQQDILSEVERRGTRGFGRFPAAEAPLMQRTRPPGDGPSRSTP